MIKTDANGVEEWNRTFGGRGVEFCYSVQRASDGGYILGGSSGPGWPEPNDFLAVKTDASGNEEWNRTFGGSNSEVCCSVQQTSDAGYILGGYTSSYGAGNIDVWLVKTGPELAVEPIMSPLPDKYALHQNYPNPFNPSTQISYDLTKASHVSLKVFNLLGREVATLADETHPTGTHHATFNGSGLPSGIYFYRLQVGEFVATRKMVLLK